MISTCFVFTTRVIQFVQLDNKSKRILHTESINISPGLIHRGQIVSIKPVIPHIRQLIAKVTVPLQKVVVIIPEDTVISKSIELPHLKDDELSEAVTWEAERLLPVAPEKFVLDWQRLHTNGKVHILFQAAEREVVDSYIQLMEACGINVGAVETPAMAMVRLAEQKPGVRVLIFIGQGEAMLTLARDQEVVATSVLRSKTHLGTEIYRTVLHMRTYYQQFPIKWLQIGGPGLSQTLIKEISVLQLPVTGFALPFPVDQKLAMPFLLGISGALKPTYPPKDQRTVNLLPQWYVQKEYQKNQRIFWKKLLSGVNIYLLVLLLTLGSVLGWLFQQERKLQTSSIVGSAIDQPLISQVTAANQGSDQIISLSKDDFYPVKTADQIHFLAPQGIQLLQIDFQIVENKGTITGMAKDRVSLLGYKKALEQISSIEDSQIPISSFTQQEDIPFQILLKLGKELSVYESTPAAFTQESKESTKSGEKQNRELRKEI